MGYNYMYNYDFDIAAIVIYFVIFIYFFQRKHIMNMQNNFFVCMLVSAFLIPVTDIYGAYLIDTQSGWVITEIVNVLYYLVKQTSTFFLLFYICSHLETNEKIPIFKWIFMIVPGLMTIVVILSNPVTGAVFTYDNYVFAYGPLSKLGYAVNIFYFVFAAIYVTYYRAMFTTKFRYVIYTVSLLNVVTQIIQSNHKGLLLYSMSMAVSILLMIMNMDRMNMTLDKDTGLAGNVYLQELIKKYSFNSQVFGTILIRVADFRHIKQSYGENNAYALANSIGRKIADYVKPGFGFCIEPGCYAIIIKNESDLESIARDIYSDINTNWKIGNMEILPTFYVTSFEYPNEVKNYDTYLAYIESFQHVTLNESGVIPIDGMHVNDKVRERQVLQAIERGLSQNNFVVYYQPICTASKQKFVTAEALVRLIDDELGFISPGEFIPIAERAGYIVEIGNFVLDAVCTFIENNDMEALGLNYIELNLSTVQCLQSNFIEVVSEITSRHHVDSKYICFEVTETASNNASAMFTRNLEILGEMGYMLALDDFGTGYSNIQRMVSSSFDIIKFDKDMTQRLSDAGKGNILHTLRSMVHSMNSKIVTEGVETQEQYETIKNAGCDYIQGYYFSKPVPEKEFREFLMERMSNYNAMIQQKGTFL